jgi:hypothetical protein
MIRVDATGRTGAWDGMLAVGLGERLFSAWERVGAGAQLGVLVVRERAGVGPAGLVRDQPGEHLAGKRREGECWRVYSDYTLTDDGLIATLDVSSTDALTLMPGTVDTGGTEPAQQSMTISPDPGPVAAIAATPAASGAATSFSAAAPHATVPPYGTLTYDWNFGDGTAANNAGPTPTHVYAMHGAYTASVTVADAAGCSTSLIWTGLNSFCAADPSATSSITVVVPPPAISKLTVSPRKIKLKIGYTLNTADNVTFTLGLKSPGREVRDHCVKPTSKSKHKKACTRLVAVHGKIAQTGKAGANSFVFNGKIGGHKLAPGTYQLTATPAGGAPKTATFQMIA